MYMWNTEVKSTCYVGIVVIVIVGIVVIVIVGICGCWMMTKSQQQHPKLYNCTQEERILVDLLATA